MSRHRHLALGERWARYLAGLASYLPFLVIAVPVVAEILRERRLPDDPLFALIVVAGQLAPLALFMVLSALLRYLFAPPHRAGVEIAIAIVLLLGTLLLYARVYLEPVFGPLPVDPVSPDVPKPASWAFVAAPPILCVFVLVTAALGWAVAVIRTISASRR